MIFDCSANSDKRPPTGQLAGKNGIHLAGEIIEVQFDGTLGFIANSYTVIERALSGNRHIPRNLMPTTVRNIVADVAEAHGLLVDDKVGLAIRHRSGDEISTEDKAVIEVRLRSAFAHCFHLAQNHFSRLSESEMRELWENFCAHSNNDAAYPDLMVNAMLSTILSEAPYGTMVNVETLYYYDGPLVFVSQSRTVSGYRQEIAFLTDDWIEDTPAENGRLRYRNRYLLGAISDADLSLLKADKITLRESLRRSPRIQYVETFDLDGAERQPWFDCTARLAVRQFSEIAPADLPGDCPLNPPSETKKA